MIESPPVTLHVVLEACWNWPKLYDLRQGQLRAPGHIPSKSALIERRFSAPNPNSMQCHSIEVHTNPKRAGIFLVFFQHIAREMFAKEFFDLFMQIH